MERLSPLLRILADGQFHSGNELGEQLGISRTAVWKRIQRLGTLALEVHCVHGKGYRLPRPLELLDAAEIGRALADDSRPLLTALEIHQKIDSTHLYLMQRARTGAPSGLACLAEVQHAGRGRRGRTWVSTFGSNIYLSLLWRSPSGPESLSGLSIATGVAVARALEDLDVSGFGLKWPNDVLWENKKLAGTLIEIAGETAGPCFVVVGVGLNLYVPEPFGTAIDQPWTDIWSMPGGTSVSRNRLAGRLMHHLLQVLHDYETHGLEPYLEDWRRLDAFAGRSVTVHTPQSEVCGIVQGIDRGGTLLLSQGGRIHRFTTGEVSLRARDGNGDNKPAGVGEL